MEKTYAKIFLIVLFMGSILSNFFVYSQIDDSIQEKINEAFIAIRLASNRGGDVAELVSSLNQLLEEANKGQLNEQEALFLLDSIIENAAYIGEQETQNNNFRISLVVLNTIVVTLLGYLTLKYFKKYYWRIWWRMRGHWGVNE